MMQKALRVKIRINGKTESPESEDSGDSVDVIIISWSFSDGEEVRWYRPILSDSLRIA